MDALVLRDRDVIGDPVLEERLYVQQDANWNVTSLADAAGGVVERYLYDPYGGGVIVLDGAWGPRGGSLYAWVYLHQGGRYETVSALYHFRNRDLSPALGRWMQRDPIELEAGDPNLYRTLGNGPVNATDPYGLWRLNLTWAGGPSFAPFGLWAQISIGTGGFGFAIGPSAGYWGSKSAGVLSLTFDNWGAKPVPGTQIYGANATLNYGAISVARGTPAPPPGAPLLPIPAALIALPPLWPAWLTPNMTSSGVSTAQWSFYIFAGIQLI